MTCVCGSDYGDGAPACPACGIAAELVLEIRTAELTDESTDHSYLIGLLVDECTPETIQAVIDETRAELDADGFLAHPRPSAAWAARAHPELEWLACLAPPALTFHVTNATALKRFYPGISAITWAALLVAK